MNRKLTGIALLIIVVSLIAAGCTENKASTASTTNNENPIKATWITARVSGDKVSIPASSVDEKTNVHFKVNTNMGELAVMAYKLEDKVFVRSNVCPPCNSIGFSLEKGTLVCDSCGTVFDAVNGTGIEGGCVAYPKEDIPYKISDGKLTMKLDDVVNAHEKTIESN